MKGIANKLSDVLKKLGYYVQEYAYVCYHWKLRFFKVLLQKMKKCGIRKKMEKAYSGLGGEVYGLHKQGIGDWQNMPSVQQQLKQVEEVEAEVFNVDQAIDEINAEFHRKRDEIKETYSLKRAEAGKEDYTDESEL